MFVNLFVSIITAQFLIKQSLNAPPAPPPTAFPETKFDKSDPKINQQPLVKPLSESSAVFPALPPFTPMRPPLLPPPLPLPPPSNYPPPPPPPNFPPPIPPLSPFVASPIESPTFVVPNEPFWNINEVPTFMQRFASIPINRMPPHLLRRLRVFCSRYPSHFQCRRKIRETIPRNHASDGNVANAFPPVPTIPQENLLAGVPKNLVERTPRLAFKELDNETRAILLKTCSEKIKCLEQDEMSKMKRKQIATHELAVLERFYETAGHNLVDEIELRLFRTQQVKYSLLQFAGIANQVVPADDGIFQNDILLTVKQSNYLINALSNPKNRKKRQSLFLDELPNEKWNISSPIKYFLDSSIDLKEEELLKTALNKIASQTCIKFERVYTQPKTSHLFYVKVSEPYLCGLSYIGKVEIVNPIYVNFACEETAGNIMHETLHALGINHEHLRSDRDDYITINWNNINPKLYDYFAVADMRHFTSYGVSYDYYSIMHYGPNVGGVDNIKPTIVPKYQSQRFLKVIGQRKALSDKDVELLTAMYCSNDCNDRNVYCGIWALKRLCALATYQIWMKDHCKKSCGLC